MEVVLGWCHQVGIGWRWLWHEKLWDSAFREQQFHSLAGNGEQESKAAEPKSRTGLTAHQHAQLTQNYHWHSSSE